MEGVAAVHVVVQGLLNQVLRFVPSQLRHSAKINPRRMSTECGGAPSTQTAISDLWAPSLHSARWAASSVKWAAKVLSVTDQSRPLRRGDPFLPWPPT